MQAIWNDIRKKIIYDLVMDNAYSDVSPINNEEPMFADSFVMGTHKLGALCSDTWKSSVKRCTVLVLDLELWGKARDSLYLWSLIFQSVKLSQYSQYLPYLAIIRIW